MAMEKTLWKHIQSLKDHAPLVHNISNYVVMNNTANALLAAGASPVMAHAQSEVREMVQIASSLVINIGTLDEYWHQSMLTAAETAQTLGKAWVLDPVGAGATPYRNTVLQELLQFRPTVIRGNASEIAALANTHQSSTKGVDSTVESHTAIEDAHVLSKAYQAVVCISGATDIIIDEQRTFYISNGHPLMGKVTGLGCTASALVAAMLGVVEDKTEATVAAMALLGVAGELAEQQSKGPGSLQVNLLDKLYSMTDNEFYAYIKCTPQ
ncbi:hydroxyethylthiazole kinase [Sphingobacterium gobiense]|uniref:Hydroxyethylthiazole kinase n=2 Tax=Sphingobacterium gobiense TaxID=1382456 RepID=A0A2S9JVV8_9SPHI|nr:hydroxyethylthiazole kinase [Sphingobacterium gobiense]